MKGYYFLVLLVLLACSSVKNGDSKQYQYDRDSLITKAAFYYSQNDYRNAITYFNELIDIDSCNGEYYFKRGYCYAKLSIPEKSISDNKLAISYEYRLLDAYYNLACDYAAIENDSLALHYFTLASKIDSISPDIKMQIFLVKSRLLEKQ